ncbi:MAG: SGNH/GDSL hydrolase family protein [Candidatus Hodarchaeota archaeon]
MPPKSSLNKLSLIIGSFLILMGLVLNEFVLIELLSPDGILETPTRMIVWFLNLLFIFTGLLIIKYNALRMAPKEIVFCLVTFLSFLFLLEGSFRVYYFLLDKQSSPKMTLSRYLGWKTVPDYYSNQPIKGYGKIIYSTKKYGFRSFGDINTTKKKIFVIGDSFTQGSTVSDGNAYYDYLKKHNDNIEIFAYGCGGYGSLQEYMILDKYVDMIDLDLILWQFSPNDFVNNDYELESLSFRNNNHMVRPYYRKGKIEWLYPKQNYGWIYSVVQSSYLLRMINIRLNILKAEKKGSIEDKLSPDNPMFKKALKTTSKIMNLVKKRAGKIPIVAFSVSNPKWMAGSFFDICKKHGIHYISGIPEALGRAKKNGIIVDGAPYDGHYNSEGHIIMGKLISDYMIREKLLIAE